MKPYTIHTGKLELVLPQYEDNSFHSCVTDSPYGMRFMGKAWDSFDIDVKSGKYNLNININAMRQFQSWTTMWAEHVYRVLAPGAYLVNFASPRTYHRMVAGLEDAGFEIRDHIFWVFSSGFPKSSNQKGEWEGWGSALKPAHEPIVIARKPLIGTIPQNLAQFKTGALNIKDSLIPGEPWKYGSQPKLNGGAYIPGQDTDGLHAKNVEGGMEGRWPANIIHDGSEEVINAFPNSNGQQGKVGPEHGDRKSVNTYGDFGPRPNCEPRNDSGSAARFFKACPYDAEDIEYMNRFIYCAKTSRKDRNEGCEKMKSKPLLWSSGTKNPGSFQSEGTDKSSPNSHPTVKPTKLMRYLIKLVTPPGGKCLDCFAGSGSTGKAGLLEHFEMTLIDEDHQWLPVQQSRCEWALNNRSNQTDLFQE